MTGLPGALGFGLAHDGDDLGFAELLFSMDDPPVTRESCHNPWSSNQGALHATMGLSSVKSAKTSCFRRTSRPHSILTASILQARRILAEST